MKSKERSPEVKDYINHNKTFESQEVYFNIYFNNTEIQVINNLTEIYAFSTDQGISAVRGVGSKLVQHWCKV